MDRVIKFRAWDDGKMLTMPTDSIYGLYRFIGFRSDDAILMQYTGLKDKNGKEIYEGDIVRSETYEVLGVVEWSYEHWAPFQYYMSQVEEDFEVIGNIYENPELLK